MNTANYKGILELKKKQLIRDIDAKIKGDDEFTISGVYGSNASFIQGVLLEGLNQPTLIILQDDGEMDNVVEELSVWTENCQIFPYPFVHASITNLEHAALLQQMKSIRAMLEPDAKNGIWITTLAALNTPCFSLDFIDEPVLIFEEGNAFKTDDLLLMLEKRGFNKEDRVDQKGDFSLRGGILDIFPRFATHPIRIEFFGDEVDTIREFSAVTQKSIRKLNRFSLDDMDYEKITDIERDGNIIDYLPENSVVFLQEPEISGKELSTSDQRSGLNELLLSDNVSFRKKYKLKRIIYGRQIENADFHFDAKAIDNTALEISEAIDFLKEKSQQKKVILIEGYGSSISLAQKGELDVWALEGELDNSFSIDSLDVEIYSEKDLVQFAESLELDSQQQSNADFVDLEMGDYVVHENYGIGQYLGLTSMEKNGVTNDYLLLQFAGSSKVYVSVAQLSLVQKYIGRGESTPELARIGSKAWELKKKKARIAIEKIVMELVRRQAFREKQRGYSFSSDSPEQRAFERSFPYKDTSCQEKASSKIKADMEGTKPMDHLLCGDVGFGKTEVAIRMAHKSLIDHKQVAILAPTTILAEQHYNNFCKRFKDKSNVIGIINRFHTTKENRETLLKVASGEIMILIGTHRILSSDVSFCDLGLMILDEEQRFGVKQKEVLKKNFPSIDCLSLSATPIPRTLHLSMLGIRGISNLTVAPENRHPIRTYIREHSRGIIKHAINRELERGGQSYFLHNRVEDINQVKEELEKLFPNARIGVGHGQMTENELSKVMNDFYALEIDILLATTIIANGIDIPTANTMVINNAQNFGLSELHQIRGRIGRYSIQAYCYLLVPSGAQLPQKGLRRLRAIEEHQDLGAGFKLAMRDMEIRGVGNILGEDQHGQISDIGYELYTQYLSQAIAELKGRSPRQFVETELSWTVGSAYFPNNFLPSHSDRIDFYRRISFAGKANDLEKIQRELRDRFGILPPPTVKMLKLFEIKLNLREHKIKSFKKKDKGLIAQLELYQWEDDDKLAWVLDNPDLMAFEGNQYILLKVDRIWNKYSDFQTEKDPYTRYSYYNEDDEIEPLEVLTIVNQFIAESTKKLNLKSLLH